MSCCVPEELCAATGGTVGDSNLMVPSQTMIMQQAQAALEPEAEAVALSEPKAEPEAASDPAACEPQACEPQASEPEAEVETAVEPGPEPEVALDPQASEIAACGPQASDPETTPEVASDPQASDTEPSEPEAFRPEVSSSQAEPKVGIAEHSPTDEQERNAALSRVASRLQSQVAGPQHRQSSTEAGIFEAEGNLGTTKQHASAQHVSDLQQVCNLLRFIHKLIKML